MTIISCPNCPARFCANCNNDGLCPNCGWDLSDDGFEVDSEEREVKENDDGPEAEVG